MSTDVHIKNCRALESMTPSEFSENKGKFAVIVDGKIREFFATLMEAATKSGLKYPNGSFSIQRVERLPATVGFIDCADYPRKNTRQ